MTLPIDHSEVLGLYFTNFVHLSHPVEKYCI